ncbi:MAG: hypothetical protein R6V85_12985 [Polyangia bacterium]
MIAKKETDGWVLAVSTHSNHLRNVWVNGPGDAWAVGEEIVLHYNGDTWNAVSDLPDGISDNYCDVWAEDSDSVWIVGGEVEEDGFAIHYDGVEWSVSFVLP